VRKPRVVWSWYCKEDEAERLLLHAELERRIGRRLECSELLEEPIIAAVVGRVDGVLRHVLFLEAEAELQSGAANVLAPAELAEPLHMLTAAAQFYRLRVVRSFVPAAMMWPAKGSRKPAIARIFEKLGFTQEDPELLTQFYKWLPQLKAKAKAQVA
jgi:hypothetical protein